MSTILRNELSLDIPVELIDEIVTWILEDDTATLRSASLVSKAWRAVALRYLFSDATFLCKDDFVRWGLIGASLPHVAQYVRDVVVDLGAKSTPEWDVDDSQIDCTFPKDSEFDVILPLMRNATSLHWTTPSAKDGFDPTSANVTRFLQSFPNITDLSCRSNLFRPGVQEHIMSFFHNLRECSFTSWCEEEYCPRQVYVFPDHGSRINVSQLEEIWCEACQLNSMNWLVDYVRHHSPSRIRKIGWEHGDHPFSEDEFVHLLLMVHETLEELCFRPQYYVNEVEDYDPPPFNKSTVLPVLQVLSFKVLQISEEGLYLMMWLDAIFAVFPSCPCLQRLEISFHLTEYQDLDAMFAAHYLDWNSLLQVRYPSVEVLEFEMILNDEEDYDDAARKRVETLVRQRTEMVDCDKFVIQWS